MGQVPTSGITQTDLYCSDNGFDHDESGLEDLTQEEAMRYSSFAEHGQRLQDAPTPEKMAASIQKVPSEFPTQSIKAPTRGSPYCREH